MHPSPPRLSVYLVEDSEILASRLAQVLKEDLDVQFVGTARDSATAIDELHDLQPDVVVVDLGLRSGTGFDVLRAVAEGSQGMLTIVLTNHSSAPYRWAAEQLGVGADRFFDKTEQIGAMTAYLRRLAESRSTSLQLGGAIGPDHEQRDRHGSLQGSRRTRNA